MNKIYGYKESDIIGLAEFIREKRYPSLKQTFAGYAMLCGKADGTVRNLYYALAKHSKNDLEFCNKYLGGKPLEVNAIEEFSDEQEKDIVKKVLLGQKQGRSARSVIIELTGGDAKQALRYQNKFRNAVKNKPRLIAELLSELKMENPNANKKVVSEDFCSLITDVQLKKIKSEINGLVSRIALKTQRENQRLKERVSILERENLRLSNLLYADGKNPKAIRYFRANNGEDMIN